MISPKIILIEEKKLVGKTLTMNYLNNRTASLWQSFMPKRNLVLNRSSEEFISLQIYSKDYDFQTLDIHKDFTSWAVAEVQSFESQSTEFETFNLESGLYAVFHYKGLNTDFSIFQYIFKEWLPQSDYVLDERPHFQILGAKYRNNDPESEEDIYIPIQTKN